MKRPLFFFSRVLLHQNYHVIEFLFSVLCKSGPSNNFSNRYGLVSQVQAVETYIISLVVHETKAQIGNVDRYISELERLLNGAAGVGPRGFRKTKPTILKVQLYTYLLELRNSNSALIRVFVIIECGI